MICSLRKVKVKVRNSTIRPGAPKLTGGENFKVVGYVEGFDPAAPSANAVRTRVRHALGTEDVKQAQRLVEKITAAYVSGADSLLWPELRNTLPFGTFKFFADRIGYKDVEVLAPSPATAKPTWAVLRRIFEQEIAAQVVRYYNRETKKAVSPGTQSTYQQTMRRFEYFLENPNTLLEDIKPAVIEKYRAERREALKGNGGSIALDIAILHRMFRFAVDREIMAKNPIISKDETKPGENPKTPARPLDADQLQRLRLVAGDDLLVYLLLRWTGLRGSDAVNLTWADVYFDSGKKGEIKIKTQKGRRLKKQAEIPLSSELRTALLNARNSQNGGPADFVLINPYTKQSYSKGDATISNAGRKKLYERVKEMGKRAKPEIDVTPHDFRDTFACDMLAKGESIYSVAKMLADTVQTVERCYAQFLPAAKDAAQDRMDNGIGIEEQAQLNRQSGQKVIELPNRNVG
jgi:integrase